MKLNIINKETEEVITVTKDVSTVGRSNKCDITISDDMSVSRTHLRLTKNENTVNITDLGSKNHTYLPDKILMKKGDSGTVKHGDTITIGQTAFIIQINDQQLPYDDDDIRLEPENDETTIGTRSNDDIPTKAQLDAELEKSNNP